MISLHILQTSVSCTHQAKVGLKFFSSESVRITNIFWKHTKKQMEKGKIKLFVKKKKPHQKKQKHAFDILWGVVFGQRNKDQFANVVLQKFQKTFYNRRKSV